MLYPRGKVLGFRVWGLGFRVWGLGLRDPHSPPARQHLHISGTSLVASSSSAARSRKVAKTRVQPSNLHTGLAFVIVDVAVPDLREKQSQQQRDVHERIAKSDLSGSFPTLEVPSEIPIFTAS